MSRYVPRCVLAAVIASALACESGGSGARAKTESEIVEPNAVSEPVAKAPKEQPKPPAGNRAANDKEAALVIDGEQALYDALDKNARAELDVAELHLACAKDAVVLEDQARTQAVSLGPLRLTRLDAPPRACRPVSVDAALLAPLYRVVEPASRWRALGAPAADAALIAQLVGDSAPLSATAPPRLIHFGHVARGIALPVEH